MSHISEQTDEDPDTTHEEDLYNESSNRDDDILSTAADEDMLTQRIVSAKTQTNSRRVGTQPVKVKATKAKKVEEVSSSESDDDGKPKYAVILKRHSSDHHRGVQVHYRDQQ